jgi:hypothetical protein
MLTTEIDIIDLKFVLLVLASVTDNTNMELLTQAIEFLVSLLDFD